MAGSAQRQGQLWSLAPLDWTHLQEAFHRPLWQALLDAVEVRAGSAFLDAACRGGGTLCGSWHG